MIFSLQIIVNIFDSKVILNILSTISVFIILNLIFMIINNWLMYILSPIRLGFIDRVTGIFLGVLKGILLSYVLFFAVHLYCYTVYDKKEYGKKEEHSEIKAEDILPNWIINSHSYQALFVTAEEVIRHVCTRVVDTKNKRDRWRNGSGKK